jgi:hypothetical protein
LKETHGTIIFGANVLAGSAWSVIEKV